jgi:hypothetical protein
MFEAMRKTLQTSVCLALVGVTIALGCDAPAAPATQPTAPAASPATIPATGPATRKTTRVPAFPADGLYVGRGYTLRVATGARPAIEALLDRHAAELSRHYKGKDWRAEAIKKFDDAKPPFLGAFALIEEFPGASTRPTAPPPAGKQPTAKLFFLANRSYVEISSYFRDKAAAGWGRPIEFDPPTCAAYRIHGFMEYDENDDDPSAAGKPPVYSYSEMMLAGTFSLAIRVGDKFSGPRVPGMLFEDGEISLYADKVTLAALPTTRPATQPTTP